MKFNEEIYQSSIEPYRPMPVDPEGLEKFLEWDRLNQKIRTLNLKREELMASILTVYEIEEMVLREVANEQKNFESLKKDLAQEISYIQNRIGGNTYVLLQKLMSCYALQEGVVEKAFSILISAEDFQIGMSQKEREEKIRKIDRDIQTLREEQEQYKKPEGYKGDYWGDQLRYIERWRYIAPRFLEEVDASGRYLNSDKRLLNIYKQLKLQDIPKIVFCNRKLTHLEQSCN